MCINIRLKSIRVFRRQFAEPVCSVMMNYDRLQMMKGEGTLNIRTVTATTSIRVRARLYVGTNDKRCSAPSQLPEQTFRFHGFINVTAGVATSPKQDNPRFVVKSTVH